VFEMVTTVHKRVYHTINRKAREIWEKYLKFTPVAIQSIPTGSTRGIEIYGQASRAELFDFH
jgi:hypothetical protein